MKITNVDVIAFRTVTSIEPSRWGYGTYLGEAASRENVTTVTRVSTDAGIDGHMLGGGPGC